jgi:peptidoglycan-associated lipoprotein
MTATRLLTLLTVASVLLASGCAEKQPAQPQRPEAAQLPAGGKPDLDSKVLPPPRPALAAAPDLSHAVYAINPGTLGAMTNGGVPANVVSALRKLDGKTYTDTAAFLAAAKDAVGEAALAQHQEALLRSALVVTLSDPPTAPGGQASLDEALARAQLGRMLTTPLTERGTDFKIVYFDFDKSNIKPEFRAVIKENAERLISSKQDIVIEGHCDERGSNEYNLALGQRRAESVRQALEGSGVPASQLTTVSFGEERPVDIGHNEAAWSKNRRAVLMSR